MLRMSPIQRNGHPFHTTLHEIQKKNDTQSWQGCKKHRKTTIIARTIATPIPIHKRHRKIQTSWQKPGYVTTCQSDKISQSISNIYTTNGIKQPYNSSYFISCGIPASSGTTRHLLQLWRTIQEEILFNIVVTESTCLPYGSPQRTINIELKKKHIPQLVWYRNSY